jgi:hypothetical protein
MNPVFRIQIIWEYNNPDIIKSKQNIWRADVGLTSVLVHGAVHHGSVFTVGQEKDK